MGECVTTLLISNILQSHITNNVYLWQSNPKKTQSHCWPPGSLLHTPHITHICHKINQNTKALKLIIKKLLLLLLLHFWWIQVAMSNIWIFHQHPHHLDQCYQWVCWPTDQACRTYPVQISCLAAGQVPMKFNMIDLHATVAVNEDCIQAVCKGHSQKVLMFELNRIDQSL